MSKQDELLAIAAGDSNLREKAAQLVKELDDNTTSYTAGSAALADWMRRAETLIIFAAISEMDKLRRVPVIR